MKDNLILKKLFLILLQLMNTILTVLLAFVTKNMLDSLGKSDSEVFFTIAVYSILILSSIVGVQTGIIYLKNKIVFLESSRIRAKSMEAILNQYKAFLTEKESSKYFSYFTKELEIYEESYLRNRLNMIGSVIMLLAGIGAIISFDMKFLFVIFLSALLTLTMPFLFAKKIQSYSDERIKKFEKLINRTKEYLDLFYCINIYRIAPTISAKYQKQSVHAMKSRKKFENHLGLSNAVVSFVSIGVSVSLYIVGGYLVLKGDLTVGSLIAVGQLMANLSIPLLEIVYGYSEMCSTKTIRLEMEKILHSKKDTQRENKKIVSYIHFIIPKIKFGEKDLLEDINIRITKGLNYAIVGANGSGKSTIGKIISGQFESFNGEVVVDGKEIAYQDIFDYGILYCSRDKQLFDEDASTNLNLFETQLVQKDIQLSLLSKLDLRKSATALSDGEKQRVILSRAVSNNAAIKIFDEPETGLDVETKSKILDLILRNDKCTNIVITHIIDDALRKFDRIIYVQNKRAYFFNSYEDFVSSSQIFNDCGNKRKRYATIEYKSVGV